MTMKLPHEDPRARRESVHNLELKPIIDTINKTNAVGIFWCDPLGQYKFINHYLRHLLRIEYDTDNELNVFTTVHSDDRRQFNTHWNQVLECQQECSINIRFSNTQDASIYAQCELVPILNQSQQVCSIMGIIIDRSRLQRAEEFLHQHYWKLEQSSPKNHQDHHLASVTHELTQPISAISIYVQQAMSKLQELGIQDDSLNYAMAKIEKLTSRSTRILNDIRGLFNHQETSPLTDITYDQIIKHSIDALNGNYAGKLSISYDLQDPPITMRVDDFKIEQVVMNLIMNANESMEKLPKHQRAIHFKTYSDDQSLYLAITDSGPGIPQEIQESIFEVFTTTKERGMGMGLPISRAICQSHGGDLTLEKSRPQETTFVIRLPRVTTSTSNHQVLEQVVSS